MSRRKDPRQEDCHRPGSTCISSSSATSSSGTTPTGAPSFSSPGPPFTDPTGPSTIDNGTYTTTPTTTVIIHATQSTTMAVSVTGPVSLPTSTSNSNSTLAKPTSASDISSTTDAGPIAGGVIGGVILLALIALGLILYLRARKKRRTPPSSEFMNSIRAGTAPVLRFDSGAEYTPALPEKGGGCGHYSPSVPPPFVQNSYYPSPAMQTMKFPEDMMDVPSERPSIDKPLHPQRYSAQQQVNDTLLARHHPGTSIGSRRELWGSDTEVASSPIPRGQSPAQTDPMLQFTPRFSLDDPSSSPLHSYSPPSLHPLRRQPDPDGT